MNSRQRILAAINHHEPDRLPVDLGGTPSSGISAIALDQLLPHLPIQNKRNWIYDVVQQVSQPSDELLDYFRIDAVDLGRTFNRRDTDWYDYTLRNGGTAQQPVWFRPEEQPDGSFIAAKNGEAIALMPPTGFTYDQIVFPFIDGYPEEYKDPDKDLGRIHWSAFAHSPWDHASELGFWETLRQRAIELRQASDRAILLGAGCNLFEWGTFMRRLDNFAADLIRCPDEVERFLDALMEVHLASLERICAAVGDLVDIIRLGDDLGMNTGPLISPAMYQRFFKPRHTALCDYVKSHSQMRTFLHSCGSIYRLIPDLIEAGFEIINPVQTSCRDMEPARLKREFGQEVTFWGAGVDTRTVLPLGTPEQVKDDVRRNIEALSPGGGYVFNTVHNILPEVPPANIIAMFEAVDEYR